MIKYIKHCILYRDNNPVVRRPSSGRPVVRRPVVRRPINISSYSPSNILAFFAASSAAFPLYHVDAGSG
jgi:hypothetical protein